MKNEQSILEMSEEEAKKRLLDLVKCVDDNFFERCAQMERKKMTEYIIHMESIKDWHKKPIHLIELYTLIRSYLYVYKQRDT